MSRATRFVALATGVFLALAFAAYAADVRVSIQTVSPTYNGSSVVFGKGGRVGNWLGTTVVMDANINVGAASDYLTNIVTFSTPSLTPALTLISADGPGGTDWTQGGTSGGIPAASEYLGNPWFCPPGTGTSPYMLFQARRRDIHSASKHAWGRV